MSTTKSKNKPPPSTDRALTDDKGKTKKTKKTKK
jgi:hypothetical protein